MLCARPMIGANAGGLSRLPVALSIGRLSVTFLLNAQGACGLPLAPCAFPTKAGSARNTTEPAQPE